MNINDISTGKPKPKAPTDGEKKTKMRSHTERGKKMYDKRRYFSEQALLNNSPWHYEKGTSYFCISAGDVDSLSFLKNVIRQQPLDYCLVSSWCFGIEDSLEIKDWVNRGLIKRIDFYIGEIAKASYAKCTEDLTEIAKSTGGRCAVFRNHSKVMLCYGDRFDCAILSSANVNTNPRTESTAIICDKGVADFYKEYYDGISPFNGSPPPMEAVERVVYG